MRVRFVRLAATEEILEKRGKCVIAEGHELALWRLEGKAYAISDICPHQHLPTLHEATLDGECITCPMHGWAFSLVTGRARSGDGRLRRYPVREKNGAVSVGIEGDDRGGVGEFRHKP